MSWNPWNYEPEYFPCCGLEIKEVIGSRITKLEPEHSEQARWNVYCSICGMTYTVEVEP